jgi:hypothetical protein
MKPSACHRRSTGGACMAAMGRRCYDDRPASLRRARQRGAHAKWAWVRRRRSRALTDLVQGSSRGFSGRADPSAPFR